jgi:aspartate/glutamate racemase
LGGTGRSGSRAQPRSVDLEPPGCSGGFKVGKESAEASRVAIIHTSFLAVESFTQLFHELAPDVCVRHVVDDSLLPEVMEAGGVTEAVHSRLCDLFRVAEKSGVDLIFSQCSSVGEVADAAAALVKVPVVKVDEAMARRACETGDRIGVAATLGTTLAPTRRLIEQTASRVGKPVRLQSVLIEGAFARLEAGDRAGHNQLVVDAIRELATEVDVVVCAQGTMAAVLPELGDVGVPVLTSPRLGVEHAVRVLREVCGASAQANPVGETGETGERA